MGIGIVRSVFSLILSVFIFFLMSAFINKADTEFWSPFFALVLTLVAVSTMVLINSDSVFRD